MCHADHPSLIVDEYRTEAATFVGAARSLCLAWEVLSTIKVDRPSIYANSNSPGTKFVGDVC